MAERKGEAVKQSHAYIVSSASQEAGLEKAWELAAAAVCSASGKRPCGLCRDCRKAANRIHPDIRLVERLLDDKGKQKRNLLVDQIRELAVDACILPNEAEGKAYILCDADTMNEAAQNAALKLLEEPPRGVVFVLCAQNPQLLLPTVRSRCVEVGLGTAQDPEEEEAQKLAKAFLRRCLGKEQTLFAWCVQNEGLDGQQTAAFLRCVQEQVMDILSGRAENPGLNRRHLLRLQELASRCLRYGKVNVGVKHIFGLLAVQGTAGAETEDT